MTNELLDNIVITLLVQEDYREADTNTLEERIKKAIKAEFGKEIICHDIEFYEVYHGDY